MEDPLRASAASCGPRRPSIPTDEDAQLTLEDVKADFRLFLLLVWAHLNLPHPTALQYDIARYLQQCPKRSIIEAFRGVGKSWITSAFVCWLLLNNPQLNILVVSASKNRADDFTTFTLRLINEIEILRHLRPGPNQRSSKISFDVGPANASHMPSVKSVGITGQLAGSRADYIIADDIEVPNNSMTEGMREKLSEAVKEFDAILKPGGKVIYLGTPQTEMSLYNKLRTRGYAMRIWPARYPDDRLRAKYGDALAPRIAAKVKLDGHLVGMTTDPERFSDDDLTERELSYGRSGFALQFMLDTSLSDAERFPLRVSDLIVTDLDNNTAPERFVWGRTPQTIYNDLPNVALEGDHFYAPVDTVGDRLPYTGKVLCIDPSGRGKDETAVNVTGQLNGQVCLLKQAAFRDGYGEETLQAIADMAKLYNVNRVIFETNFGDAMFGRLLSPYLQRTHPVTIEEVRSKSQKELRIIESLEPVMNQHRLVIDRGVIEEDYASTRALPAEEGMYYQLVYQLTRLTRERKCLRHDDRLDCLAIAVEYWDSALSVNQEEAMQETRFEKLQEEVDLIQRNALPGWHTLAVKDHRDPFAPGHGSSKPLTMFSRR
jgi:hypothetical protein